MENRVMAATDLSSETRHNNLSVGPKGRLFPVNHRENPCRYYGPADLRNLTFDVVFCGARGARKHPVHRPHRHKHAFGETFLFP
jgi:hypothetical protein